METIRTKGITAKDMFNATSATPIKMAKNTIITVTDILVKEKSDGETVGYLKADDETMYATISATVIDQLSALAELVDTEPQEVLVTPKTSNSGREYFLLELQ